MIWRSIRCALGALVLSTSGAFASERIACVQAQLAQLGYGISDQDGRITSQTRAAVRSAYRDIGTDIGLKLPFDDRRAGQWCRRLGQTYPNLQDSWPSKRPKLILTDSADQAAKLALLSKANETTRAFYKDQFGLVLSGSHALIGTDDPTQLHAYLASALEQRGARARKKPLNVEKLCAGRAVGAAANRDFIAMCWRKPKRYDADWAAKNAGRITSVLVHEYMHQTQYELTIDRPARRLKDNSDWVLGPSWMVEGSAEVIEAMFLAGDDDAGQTLFKMQKPARRARVTLPDLNVAGSVRGAPAYGTARFAAYVLAQRHGVQSLFEYFEALGETGQRDAAFQQAFGQSLQQYEAEFEGLRRDFGAARDYIRAGDGI